MNATMLFFHEYEDGSRIDTIEVLVENGGKVGKDKMARRRVCFVN
jgi:hypothetical protein